MTNPLNELRKYTPEYHPEMGQKVPRHLREGLAAYMIEGLVPGSFLQACIANNFTAAVTRVDDLTTAKDLRAIALMLHWCLPAHAYGSEHAITEWQRLGGLRGVKETA